MSRYPTQQALAAFPVGMPWPVLLVLSALATTLFAYVSWHYVEKPILRFRRLFAVLARERETRVHQTVVLEPISRDRGHAE